MLATGRALLSCSGPVRGLCDQGTCHLEPVSHPHLSSCSLPWGPRISGPKLLSQETRVHLSLFFRDKAKGAASGGRSQSLVWGADPKGRVLPMQTDMGQSGGTRGQVRPGQLPCADAQKWISQGEWISQHTSSCS